MLQCIYQISFDQTFLDLAGLSMEACLRKFAVVMSMRVREQLKRGMAWVYDRYVKDLSLNVWQSR
jgi:hypothetical protein